MIPIYRCGDPAKAFLFHGAQKIARILLRVQSSFRRGRRIKAAFESETGFHGGVIKGAEDKILAVATLPTPRQILMFVRKTLHYFRPCNVGDCLRQGRLPPRDNDRPAYSPKPAS